MLSFTARSSRLAHHAGSSDGFGYSGALKASTVVWDEDSLMEWLLSPKKFIKARRRQALSPPQSAYPPRRRPLKAPDCLACSRTLVNFFAQGNKMVFAGIKKKDERANLIAYIQVRPSAALLWHCEARAAFASFRSRHGTTSFRSPRPCVDSTGGERLIFL